MVQKMLRLREAKNRIELMREIQVLEDGRVPGKEAKKLEN